MQIFKTTIYDLLISTKQNKVITDNPTDDWEWLIDQMEINEIL